MGIFDRFKKYSEGGFDKDGFDKHGYNDFGFNRNGIHEETGTKFDEEGWSKERIHEKTGTKFDELGFDYFGNNIDGFDKDGYNEKGYDKDGYTEKGYDKDGFDKFGFDKFGFDRNLIHTVTGTKFDEEGNDREQVKRKRKLERKRESRKLRYEHERKKLEWEESQLNSHACPKCHSKDVIEIIYGLPSDELVKESRQGKFALGGCCVDESNPNLECNSCDNRF